MAQALARTVCIADQPRSRSTGQSFFSVLSSMLKTARTRRALARLDASQLKDIGISPEDARTEAKRPLWDAPRIWRM